MAGLFIEKAVESSPNRSQLQLAWRIDDNDRSSPLYEEGMFFGAAKARYVWLHAKSEQKKKLSLYIISAFLHDRSTSESEMEGPGEEGCQ